MKSMLLNCARLMLLTGLLALMACTTQQTVTPEPPTREVQTSAPTGQKAAAEPVLAPAHDLSPRDVSNFRMFKFLGGSATGATQFRIEDTLEKGLFGAGVSPVHLVAVGTPVAGTTRCGWHPIVRTMADRDILIRGWLDLGDNTLPSPRRLEATFNQYVDDMAPEFQDAMRANFRHLAYGGVFADGPHLACYVDFAVSEYVLGTGSDRITVAYGQMVKTRSYDLYKKAHAAGGFDGPLLTVIQWDNRNLDALIATENSLKGIVEGRKSVLFLAPFGEHGSVAVESWQVVDQWDVQTVNGETRAVRYGSHSNDPDASLLLSNLKTRVAAAATADGKTRIANVSSLNQYYRDIGAYSDITPGDGSTETFTPEQPPTVYACNSGTAVRNRSTKRALVRDCSKLLELKSTLAGTAALDWSSVAAIDRWTGLTLSGNPQRVARIELPSKNLNGTIPADLSEIGWLAVLDLSNNQLTGEIPADLAKLPRLSELKLAGNSFTGCIPAALRGVQNSDLSNVGLEYCDVAAPDQIADLSVTGSFDTRVELAWTKPNDNHAEITSYRLQVKKGDGEFVEASSDDSPGSDAVVFTVQSLKPNTEYVFRLLAVNRIGEAGWSNEVATRTATSVPDTMVAPSVSARSITSLNVSWQAPADNGAAITEYVLQRKATADLVYVDVNTFDSSVLSHVDSGLSENTGYSYRIKARNSNGDARAWSEDGVATTTVRPPQTITHLAARVVNSSSIYVTWAYPDQDPNPITSYKLQRRVEDGDFIDVSPGPDPTVSIDSYTDSGLSPYTLYGYRIKAVNSAGESDWSNVDSERTLSVPTFGASAYSWNVYEDAAVNTEVGTVVATDPLSRPIAYSITNGNADGRFTIGSATGIITLAGVLDYGTAGSYGLTVTATDEVNETSTVVVNISVVRPCYNGIVVENPENNAAMVRDCIALLEGRDTLAGSASLNWSRELSIQSWTGLRFDTNVPGVYGLELNSKGLNGRIPPSLGRLSNLESLYLGVNSLSGSIPPELANISTLYDLRLNHNQLTGSIPTQLGNVSSLAVLLLSNNRLTGSIPTQLGNNSEMLDLRLSHNQLTGSIPTQLGNLKKTYNLALDNNQLTGSIPTQLGSMTALQDLRLDHNRLTGSIPAELANPVGLNILTVSENSLTGCVPRALMRIKHNDFELAYCPQ